MWGGEDFSPMYGEDCRDRPLCGEGSCRDKGPCTVTCITRYANARNDECVKSLMHEGGIKGQVAADENLHHANARVRHFGVEQVASCNHE